MDFIDFHAHLHPTLEARGRLLETMDKLSIKKAVVVAGGVVAPTNLRGELNNAPVPNAKVRELCNGSSGRLFPFYFVNPFVSSDEYQEEGKNYLGLKLGPAVHGVALVDERYRRYLELAEVFQHPVYLHCLPRIGFDVEALTQLAKEFTKVNFILGHAGIGNCDFEAVQKIKGFSNIYFETSGGFSSVISFAVTHLSIERILFGTEYPLQRPEIELEKMRCLNLTAEILNANALRVLRRAS